MSSLAPIPAFAALSGARLAELDDASRPVRHRSGAAIRVAGEPASSLLLLLDGVVSAGHVGPSGDQVWLARWQGPAIVDKASVLRGGEQASDLVAATACSGRWLPRDRFLTLLEREPSVRRRVLDKLAGEVLAQQARLAASTLPAGARVAAWLLERSAAPGDVVWRGSQEQLGWMLGLSRVTVNRVLRRLAGAGCVGVAPGSVRVLDPARLRRFLG